MCSSRKTSPYATGSPAPISRPVDLAARAMTQVGVGTGKGCRVKSLGPSLIAFSLFIRDRAAQSVADLLVVHLGIGPFGVATGMLRVAAVLQAATITTKVISEHFEMQSLFEVVMAAIFCWVCVIWAKVTAVAARRPPRFGSPTASALRRDDYLILVVLVLAFVFWDLWTVIGVASFTEVLTTASDTMQGLGFLLGSTLWRNLPQSRRQSDVAAPSAT